MLLKKMSGVQSMLVTALDAVMGAGRFLRPVFPSASTSRHRDRVT